MATAATTDLTEQVDYECSSSSCSSDSPFEGRGVSMIYKRQHSETHRQNDKSLPVFDLRYKRIAKAQFTNISLKSFSNADVVKKVAEQFKAKETRVFLVESKGRLEETLVQTRIILLPENDHPNRIIVVVETLEVLEQTHPILWCALLDKTATFLQIKDLLLSELNWRSGAVCLNNKIPMPDSTLENCVVDNNCKLQAIKSSVRSINLIFKPKPNVSYTYMLDVDITSTVNNIKHVFLGQFKDDLLVQQIVPGHIIHFFFHDMFLNDNTCIGMLLRGSKDETFVMHIAPVDAICVTLKYRIQRGKTRVPYYQQISIPPNCSTRSLRTEAAKYLNVDPMAIKLTCDNKRVEEHESLKGLKKGSLIGVGIKKKKNLLIRHPVTQQEHSISLFMLETVQVLKREIGEAFNVDPLKLSLQCRDTEMQDKNLLLNYPIKNNMELGMDIYNHRITILVFILFKRVKLKLVIDNSRVTTVDDILMYCARKLRYRREHSRSIFDHKCLHKNRTLYEEKVHSGSMVYIVHFENSERQYGKLMTIYTVRPDGQTNPRIGSICGGVLLHASKKVQLKTEEREEERDEEVPLLSGIHVDENFPVEEVQNRTTCESCQVHRAVVRSEGTLGAVARKIDKEKYLRKARAVFQRRFDKEQTCRKQLYMEEEVFMWNKSAENPQTVRNPKYTKQVSDLREPRTLLPASLESSPVNFYSPTSPAGELQDHHMTLSQPIREHDTRQVPLNYVPATHSPFVPVDASTDTEEDAIGTIEGDQPMSKKKMASISSQTDCYTYLEKSPMECNKFGNDMVALQDVRNSPGHFYSSLDDSTSGVNDSSSSQDQSTETNYEQNLERFYRLSKETGRIRCPFLAGCNTGMVHTMAVVRSVQPTLRSMSNPPRQRYRTVGEGDYEREFAQIIHSCTYPQLAISSQDSNADLETAGINMPLLSYVARQIGKDWKQLARQLSIDEHDLEEIEHQQRSLFETSIQSLIAWKRSNGTRASKQKLLDALRNIGKQSIVEKCEGENQITLQYQTA